MLNDKVESRVEWETCQLQCYQAQGKTIEEPKTHQDTTRYRTSVNGVFTEIFVVGLMNQYLNHKSVNIYLHQYLNKVTSVI